MNQPKIRFFISSVGESIAYAVHGAGPYLVVPAWWVSHLELDWQSEDYRHFFEALAEHHTIVRYDRPGTGLSNRKRVSFELEDEVKILAELIEHIGIKNCSLLGISCGGPAAVVYAHRYPHRIDKLVFIGSFVDGDDIGDDDIQHALCALVLAHWGVGAKAIIDLFDPDMITEQRKIMGETHKSSASSSMAYSLLKLTFEMDVKETAKKLIKPTLVLHRNKDKTVSMDAGRQLAAMIPNAEFKSIEGRAHLPWIGVEAEQFVKEILSFTEVYRLPNKINVNQFICSGDFWTLSYNQKTVHIKDMLGLHDLHH